MLYAQPRISWRMRCTSTSGFCDTNGSLNLCQMIRPSNNQEKKKKKRTRIVDFAVPEDQ